MVLWRAKEATITIGNLIPSISDTDALSGQMVSGVDFSGKIKNISISGAESDTDSVYLFGATTSGQQNAEIEEQNMSQREFSGTLIYTDTDSGALATADATMVGTTGFNRIQGDGTRTKKAILVTFADGSNSVNILMNNSFFTKLGDISLDAKGHAEQEITAKGLARDYYEEDDF